MKSLKVMLYFPIDRTGRPLSARLIKDYNLIFNILQAQIRPGIPGELALELTGEEADLQAGLAFLEAEGIQVAPLSHSVVWTKDKCVQCGGCTGVCPSSALALDENVNLVFDQEKCIVCQACVKACPLKALRVSYVQETE